VSRRGNRWLLLGRTPPEIIFTGCGTESNKRGVARGAERPAPHEHYYHPRGSPGGFSAVRFLAEQNQT